MAAVSGTDRRGGIEAGATDEAAGPCGRVRRRVGPGRRRALAACSVPREADLAASGRGDAERHDRECDAHPHADADAHADSRRPRPRRRPRPTPKVVPPTREERPRLLAHRRASRRSATRLTAVRGAGDLFGAATVKSVSRGATPVGVLFLFAVRPQAVGDPEDLLARPAQGRRRRDGRRDEDVDAAVREPAGGRRQLADEGHDRALVRRGRARRSSSAAAPPQRSTELRARVHRAPLTTQSLG